MKIKPTQAEVGMQLADDIVDTNHVRLFKAGKCLSVDDISKIKNLDVDVILINVSSLQDGQVFHQLIKSQIALRFRKVGAEPLMSQLKQALLDYRLRGDA